VVVAEERADGRDDVGLVLRERDLLGAGDVELEDAPVRDLAHPRIELAELLRRGDVLVDDEDDLVRLQRAGRRAEQGGRDQECYKSSRNAHPSGLRSCPLARYSGKGAG
jgi:hypothetical protein